MSTSSTPQLPTPKIYTIDVSKYPEAERPLRALMHWKKIFPDVTSVRIGIHDETGSPCIAANQFGDRLEVKGMKREGWYVHYQDWYKLKTDDPEMKALFQAGGKLFKEGLRNEAAMSAQLVGLQYRPWLGNSLFELTKTMMAKKDYVEQRKKNIADRAMRHVEFCVRELNAGYRIVENKNDPFSFTWKATKRYASDTAPEAMLKDLMENLPENTRNLISLTTTGGTIAFPENAFSWNPMSEDQAEAVLLNTRRQAVLEGTASDPDERRDKSYDNLFAHIENYTWIRNGFLQGDIGADMVRLAKNGMPYAFSSLGTEMHGAGAVAKDAVELLDLGRQGLLRLDHLMSTVAPDAITSMAMHAQENVLRKEREALLQAPKVEPTELDTPFPKDITELQVGDHCAVGTEDRVNWCRVQERDGDVVKFWLINGAWAFKMDLSTGECLPHEVGIDLSEMKVLSTAKTPFEGVDSHYNEAITYYRKLLGQKIEVGYEDDVQAPASV